MQYRTVSLQLIDVGGGGRATVSEIGVTDSATPAGTSPNTADVDEGVNEGVGKPATEPLAKVAAAMVRPRGAHVRDTFARSMVARTERNGPGEAVTLVARITFDPLCLILVSRIDTFRSSQHEAHRGKSTHVATASHALKYPVG